MKDKRTEDIVAGRLTGIRGGKTQPPAGPTKKAGAYGAVRLGIVCDTEPPPAGDGPHGSCRRKEDLLNRLAPVGAPRDALTSRAASLEPFWDDQTPDPEDAIQEEAPADLAAGSWRKGKRTLLVIGIAGGVVVFAAGWLIWSALRSDAPGPQTASAANHDLDPKAVAPPDGGGQVNRQPGKPGGDGAHPDRQIRDDTDRSAQPGDIEPVDEPLAAAWARLAGRPLPGLAERPTERPDPRPPAEYRRPTAPADTEAEPAVESVRVPPKPAESRPSSQASTGAPTAQSRPASQTPHGYRTCPTGIKLTGMIRQPGGGLAVINGRVVAVGQTVNGAKVVKIMESAVEMELDGERFMVGYSTGQEEPAPAKDGDAKRPEAPADKGAPTSKPSAPQSQPAGKEE